MSDFVVNAQAPSNIALIKYMGKKDSIRNIPENPSISLTLNSLHTLAEVTVTPGGSGTLQWISEPPRGGEPSTLVVPDLGGPAQDRMAQFFDRVRAELPTVLGPWGLKLRKSLDQEKF